MGGVDKLDQCISYYRTFIISKKWTLRLFTHFLDFAVVSAWFEYRKDYESSGLPSNKYLDLLSFRMEIIDHLLYVGKPTNLKRGRPSNNSPNLIRKPHNATEIRPSASVSLDLFDHMPYMDSKKEATRCKQVACKGRTHMMCDKCNIHLCISKSNDCFRKYHRNLKVYIHFYI